MNKVRTIALLGVGYVLGTKAGRARYEQIKQQAARLAEHPRTQQLAQTAREQVAARVPGAVTERLPRSVSSRLGATQPSPRSTATGYPEESAANSGDATSRTIDARTSADLNRDSMTDPVAEI